MVMLIKKALLLAKIETEYGEDPTPAPAEDAILVSAPNIRPIGEKLERENVRPSSPSSRMSSAQGMLR